MSKEINIVHYWGGFPIIATSKWLSALKLVQQCADNNWNNWLVLSKKPDDVSLITPFIEAGCQIIYHPRSRGNFDFASVMRNVKFLLKIKSSANKFPYLTIIINIIFLLLLIPLL